MQPDERDAAYLWDMLLACDEIEAMLEGFDLAAFLHNRMLLRAIERDVELIGEAAERLSQALREANPGIPWRMIIGQRNILAHEYGRIDHELLYHTAIEDIPELASRVRSILPPLEGDPSEGESKPGTESPRGTQPYRGLRGDHPDDPKSRLCAGFFHDADVGQAAGKRSCG
jgi:uncharacterized protein with HEPN domain